MFGLEVFFGRLVGKIALIGGALLALVMAYLGIKQKGKTEARQERALEDAAARQEQQGRLDTARDQDREIDARVAAEISRVRPPAPSPTPPANLEEGAAFKLAWILLLLPILLAGCPKAVPYVPPVHVDIPPRPVLAACLETPHPVGVVVTRDGRKGVWFLLQDAQALQVYLREAPGCWAAREILWQGHVEKLENRIRAVNGEAAR